MVHVISVDAAHRRRGVGRALVAAMIKRLQKDGVTRWAVSYWAFNMGSEALFAGFGAEPHLVFAEAFL